MRRSSASRPGRMARHSFIRGFARARWRHPAVDWPTRGRTMDAGTAGPPRSCFHSRSRESVRYAGWVGVQTATGARCVVASASCPHHGCDSWPFVRTRSVPCASPREWCGCISLSCPRSCLPTAVTCRRVRNTRWRRCTSTVSCGAAGSRSGGLRVAIRSARVDSTRSRHAETAGAGRSRDCESRSAGPVSGMTFGRTGWDWVLPAQVDASRTGRER